MGGGHLLERYYHHLFTTDEHIAALYSELGMADELEWRRVEGRDLLGRPPAAVHYAARPAALQRRSRRLRGCAWALAVLCLQMRARDVGPVERMTAREWIGAMGRQAWDKVWGPLLRGKFGDRADEISMAWLWSKLTLRRADERRGGAPGAARLPARQLGAALRARCVSAIEAAGGRVLIDRPAARIARARRAAARSRRRGRLVPQRPRPARLRARAASRGAYDAVVATVPSDVFARLLDAELAAAVGADYLERLRAAEYQTALCLLLELDRQFSPYYWTNIADPRLPFIGLVEHTNFIEPERYDGRRFLYVANYVAPGDPLLGARRRCAARRLRAGAAPRQPGLLARLDQAGAGCFASRPPSRS